MWQHCNRHQHCIPSSSPDHDFSTFLDPPIQSSFYFDPFVPAEVEDEIKVLPNNKAYGLYSCPVSILKLSSHIISQPLAQIFNVSVSSGSFPAKLRGDEWSLRAFARMRAL